MLAKFAKRLLLGVGIMKIGLGVGFRLQACACV